MICFGTARPDGHDAIHGSDGWEAGVRGQTGQQWDSSDFDWGTSWHGVGTVAEGPSPQTQWTSECIGDRPWPACCSAIKWRHDGVQGLTDGIHLVREEQHSAAQT